MADPLLDVIGGGAAPALQGTPAPQGDPLLNLIGSSDSAPPPGGLPTLAPAAVSPAPKQANPMSRTDKVLAGMADPIHGGAQLLTHVLPTSVVDAGNSVNNWLADKTGLFPKLQERNVSSLVTGGPTGVDKLVADRESAYQASRKAAGESGFDGYRTIGNVLSPANLALAYASPVAVGLPMQMVTGVGTGAATAALNPVTDGSDYWSEKRKQLGLGAATGFLSPLAAAGVARIISPNASTNADLQLLQQSGVKPTIGQTLGGWANALEEKAQSIPLVGDLIAYNRRKAMEQFNNAAINRSTAPIGQTVQGAGTDAIADAGNKLSAAYAAAKNQLGGFTLDSTATTELQRLQGLAQQLPPREAREFGNIWATVQSQIGPNGQILPDTFKQIDSHLGQKGSSFGGSQDAYQKQLGDAVSEMQRIITDNAKRANPAAARALADADAGYANLVRVEGAGVGAKAGNGVFTPGQLLTAVRQSDKSVRDRATARGEALMQDLATAGQNVLGNKIPDSGTAGRLSLTALGGALVYNPLVTGSLLGAGLGLNAPPVQSLLRGAVSARPNAAKPVAEALRKATPMLLPAGSQLGLGLLNQ